MEGLLPATPFAKFAAGALKDSQFTLIDVGCSSGIDDAWRVFGDRLTAFGFDPNLEEIARLTAKETLPLVQYIAAFVGLAPEDPSYPKFRSGDFWSRSPWSRLSVERTLALRQSGADKTDVAQKPRERSALPLADPEKPVVLPQFLANSRVEDVDFLKIDVDGPDYLILRSLQSCLQDKQVLGVGIEVNYFGGTDPDSHSLHNVDRFMRSLGFDLFALSIRKYSVAALPAPYCQPTPSQTESGRPAQGDAVYLRDLASPEHAEWAPRAPSDKLLKLAILFSLLALPDCAAELLLTFRKQLADLIDVDQGLDALIQQGPLRDRYASYQDYMAGFKAEASDFYPHASQIGDPAELRKMIGDIYSSTSWKVTAPLRAIANALGWPREAGGRRQPE